MSLVILKGVAFETRSCALIVGVADAFEQLGIPDDDLHLRLFKGGKPLQVVSILDEPAFALTPWAELTLREVLALSLQPWPIPVRRRLIEDALSFAGYADKEPA